MRKVFGIVLSLALVLTAVVASAVPAAAVTEGTIEVCVDNPVAKEPSHYCILFHNGSTLKGHDGDFIDLVFPYGTNSTTCDEVTVQTSLAPPTLLPICGPCVCPIKWESCPEQPPVFTINNTVQNISPQSMRIHIDDGFVIEKCWYVLIMTCNITNPMSCKHHLEVGTSTHTPVESEEYTIYCAKIGLTGGKNPDGSDKMNLISLPCYPIDTSIEAVLADLFLQVKVTAGSSRPFSFSVWYYDTGEAKWYKYASDTSFADLKTIEPGKAYWVKPSDKTVIYIHGYPYPPGQGPPVKWHYDRSWNMVGVASLTPILASSYLFYTLLAPMYGSYCVLAIWWFDSINQIYMDTRWIGDIPPTTDPWLIPARGYWMAFVADCCYIIPPAQADC